VRLDLAARQVGLVLRERLGAYGLRFSVSTALATVSSSARIVGRSCPSQFLPLVAAARAMLSSLSQAPIGPDEAEIDKSCFVSILREAVRNDESSS
jgi:hypothetical protein